MNHDPTTTTRPPRGVGYPVRTTDLHHPRVECGCLSTISRRTSGTLHRPSRVGLDDVDLSTGSRVMTSTDPTAQRPPRGWLDAAKVGDEFWLYKAEGGGINSVPTYRLLRATVTRALKTKLVVIANRPNDTTMQIDIRRGNGRSQWIDYKNEGDEIIPRGHYRSYRSGWRLYPLDHPGLLEWVANQAATADAEREHRQLADDLGRHTSVIEWRAAPIEVLRQIHELMAPYRSS